MIKIRREDILPEEETNKYFKKLYNGEDVEGCLEKLFRSFYRLIPYVVREVGYKLRKGFVDREDLLSIGSMGLIKAIKTFDSSKGVVFPNYAIKCIRNEIGMNLRKPNKANSKEAYSLDEPFKENNKQEANNVSLGELQDSGYDVIETYEKHYELAETVNKCLNKCTDREIILVKYYGLDGKESLNQKEIADEIGISRSYVSRIIIETLGTLENYLKEDINQDQSEL
jgi:RNA polymerase sporulation-specific sigma factor